MNSLAVRAEEARAAFFETTPGMGSERQVALGRWNLILILMQLNAEKQVVSKNGNNKPVYINTPPVQLERRTIEIAEGMHTEDTVNELYYNGRWHEAGEAEL